MFLKTDLRAKTYIADAMKKLVTLLAAMLCLCSCEDFLKIFDGDGDDEAEEMASAYSVEEAKAHIGESDVWVKGYIVGGDLTSSKVNFHPPFKARTCLAIAADSTCVQRDSCLSVQLPSGAIRDSLNLADRPGVLGKEVRLKGKLVSSYYGIPGLQNVSRFHLE